MIAKKVQKCKKILQNAHQMSEKHKDEVSISPHFGDFSFDFR